jgi:hypothetical protein
LALPIQLHLEGQVLQTPIVTCFDPSHGRIIHKKRTKAIEMDAAAELQQI